MGRHTKTGIIEKIATRVGLIPNLERDDPAPFLKRTANFQAQSSSDRADGPAIDGRLRMPIGLEDISEGIHTGPFPLASHPDEADWDHWEELDPQSWPVLEKKAYSLIPTTCFNCESACGMVAYVDKDTKEVRKFEGNPLHPGSRGRNCAKGPATKNQLDDPDRILFPMKRSGPRGSGQYERISWKQALDEIGGAIGKSFDAKRHNNVVYHVGRPGHEGYMDRVLKGWGIDGHNSHTTICSAGARHGYSLWMKSDRPSPDHANARVILLVSAHLESGHYFNPHAQRIMEGVMKGAKLVVMDPRLSNTASMASLWMPTQPGSEAAVFLAVARLMLENRTYSETQFRDWTNWREFLATEHPMVTPTWESFREVLLHEWRQFTPEFAASEARIPVEHIHQLHDMLANCGGRLAAHTWRAASIGNLGGWQVARTLQLLVVMTGSVGVKGGTLPSTWNKFKPKMFDEPPAVKFWNKLQFPDEWSVAQYEMSHCLPHLLREKNEKIDVYFTRVFNPVWTYPDGFSWIEMLRDENRVGVHVALTPTWNETAYFADYVLPMGHASERHDINSYETDAGMWIAFRQPVVREMLRREGKAVNRTWECNPGEVWEEDEFWIDLSWAIDPDGGRGIRKHFESKQKPGTPVSVDEYYSHIFDHVPGLMDAARQKNTTPLEYMKRYGAFKVSEHCYEQHLREIPKSELAGYNYDKQGRVVDKHNKVVGILFQNRPVEGFPTPSRLLEIFSPSMKAHGWKERKYTLPNYLLSHVHPSELDYDKGDMVLVPTFRLPTLIHTRTGAAKWLNEISNINPMWMHPSDMARLGVTNGDVVRVNTEIGWFVDRVWGTESIKPGVCACSHHIGRWRRRQDPKGNRFSAAIVDMSEKGSGKWMMRHEQGVEPFASPDPDTSRIFWGGGGVHQNAAAPIHPDPISGANCWLQKVRVEKAHADDQYGDVVADTNKSHQVYLEWKKMCRPVTEKGKPRRIQWLNRPLAPVGEAWILGGAEGE